MGSSVIRLLSVTVLCATAACSTVQTPSPADPLEGFNRSVDSFNTVLDNAVIKPVAQGYQAAIPAPVRGCVSNFFGNIGDIFIAVNNALQGKVKDAASDVCRVGVNTTVGIFGLFDVASEIGLTKHNEDFGQTFGRWGADSGPYLVLPFFGPSSLRDGVGLVLDVAANPMRNINDIPVRNSLMATRIVDKRAELLEASDVVDQFAFDKYSFIRDAYLARRKNLVYDGNPPIEKQEEPMVSNEPVFILGKPADRRSPWAQLEPVVARNAMYTPRLVGSRAAFALSKMSSKTEPVEASESKAHVGSLNKVSRQQRAQRSTQWVATAQLMPVVSSEIDIDALRVRVVSLPEVDSQAAMLTN